MTATGIFSYYYFHYSRMIEAELKAGVFSNATLLYAAPRPVTSAKQITGEEIAAYLRRCGYSTSNTSRMGWYRVRPDAIEINPGPDAYDPEGAVIKIAGGQVTQIISLRDHTERTQYLLEPELITNLFDKKREKRRIVRLRRYSQGDGERGAVGRGQTFFSARRLRSDRHRARGVARCEGSTSGWKALRRSPSNWRARCGSGTERGWRRKIPETLITLHLEQKLTKQQIFEYYANSIYLGNQGSFSIHGFGEGAQVYFGKDLSKITLPEAAMLAGLIQSPGGRNPFRHPDGPWRAAIWC